MLIRTRLPFRAVPSLVAIAVLAPAKSVHGMVSYTATKPQSTNRDSAGVVIVENERPASGSRLGWRIGDTPSLSIGSQDGEDPYLLFGVEDATRLDDGRLVVANSSSGEIRVFASDGSHVTSLGGIGEGPGEFAQYDPVAVSAWPGDSIVAGAWWRGRIEVFDADGGHGRTAPLGDGKFSLAGVLPDDIILAVPSIAIGVPFGRANAPLARRDEEFGLMRPDGTLHVSLGTRAGQEWFVSASSPSAQPHPFGRSVLTAVWGDLAIVTTNDRYEISAYTSDGTLARIVRRGHDLRSPTQAEIDNWIGERYADEPEERRERLLGEMDGMTTVEFYPAFSSLQSDPLGYLWVEEYSSPSQDRSLWTVFDSQGRVQGFVEMPAEIEVYEIGVDYVLGKTTDELEVELVRLWPLDRS